MADAAQYGPAETVMQLCNGYRVSQALYVAAQLQIAEHLATGALSSAALAQAALDPQAAAVELDDAAGERQPEAGDVEQCRQTLIGYEDIDVFEMDRVAEIFGGAVEWLHDCDPR